jgi:hypothetical protein
MRRIALIILALFSLATLTFGQSSANTGFFSTTQNDLRISPGLVLRF